MKTNAASATSAFSLAELAIAIGIVATCLVSLLAILGQGVSQAGESARLADAALIQRNLRTRLLDPKFPAEKKDTEAGWETEVYINGRGSIVVKPEEAMFIASLSSGSGLGFESNFIERIHVDLKAIGGAREFASFNLQRVLPLNPKEAE